MHVLQRAQQVGRTAGQPGSSGQEPDCSPWDAFSAAMRLMKEKPDATDAEIAEAVATCSVGEDGAPAAIQAAADKPLAGSPQAGSSQAGSPQVRNPTRDGDKHVRQQLHLERIAAGDTERN